MQVIYLNQGKPTEVMGAGWVSIPGIRLTRDSWNTKVITQKRPECPPMEGRGFRGLKPLWHMVSRLKWIPHSALHDVMHKVKEIRYTQARQALFGQLDEGAGPITDDVVLLKYSAVSILLIS